MRLPFFTFLLLVFLSASQLIAEDAQSESQAEKPHLKAEEENKKLDVIDENTALIAAARESLIKNSPFGSNAAQEAPRMPTGPKVPARYELHGIMNLEGKWQFSLYDPKAKVSQWIISNDPAAPVKVINFNQQKNSVTILDNGQVQELVLKKPDASGSSYIPPSGVGGFGSGGPSGSDFPSKEEFLELMLGKQKLNDKFKNPPGSRTRSGGFDDEDFDDIPSSKSGKKSAYDDEDEDYEE